jgi:hypothetical protein
VTALATPPSSFSCLIIFSSIKHWIMSIVNRVLFGIWRNCEWEELWARIWLKLVTYLLSCYRKIYVVNLGFPLATEQLVTVRKSRPVQFLSISELINLLCCLR